MKKANILIFITICCLLILVPVYANALEADIITEDEVLQAVESLGKDKAAGNIFLWFLCALAFLKVSTKMDSLMAALGINVARTAGSMIGDTMMIMKSMNMLTGGGGFMGMGRGHSSSGSGNDSGGGSFLEGGLAGVIGRQVTQSAVQSATDTGGNVLANKMFESSLSSGGQFAQNIIGQIATGDINKTGTISGDKAATALTAYFGDNLNDSIGMMPLVESNNDGFMPIGDQENIAETAPTQIAGGINNMEALNESELQEVGTLG